MRRGSTRKRCSANASSSTRRPTKAGPGGSSRPTAMSAGCRPMRSARRPRRRPTRSSVPRTLGFSRAGHQVAARRGAADGRGLAVARQDERFAVIANGWHLPRTHLVPAQVAAARFRRRRRTIPPHALSVGRQDVARHRLLGASAGLAASRGHRLPARQRHAGTGARKIVIARRTAPWRSRVLERPRRHRPRRRNANSTRTRTT